MNIAKTQNVSAETYIEAWGQAHKADIQAMIPRGTITADRFLMSFKMEVMRNPKLQQCNKRSLIKSAKEVMGFGLEIGGLLGQAYLIPCKDRCTFQLGYKGLITLALRSGTVEWIDAQTVFTGDKCKITLGDDPRVEHELDLDGARTTPRGYYAVAKLSNGIEKAAYMSAREVEAVRQGFSKSADADTWVKSFNEMAKKTVLKRLLKLLPIDTAAMEAVEADEARQYMNPEDVPARNTESAVVSEVKKEPPKTSPASGEQESKQEPKIATKSVKAAIKAKQENEATKAEDTEKDSGDNDKKDEGQRGLIEPYKMSKPAREWTKEKLGRDIYGCDDVVELYYRLLHNGDLTDEERDILKKYEKDLTALEDAGARVMESKFNQLGAEAITNDEPGNDSDLIF